MSAFAAQWHFWSDVLRKVNEIRPLKVNLEYVLNFAEFSLLSVLDRAGRLDEHRQESSQDEVRRLSEVVISLPDRASAATELRRGLFDPCIPEVRYCSLGMVNV